MPRTAAFAAAASRGFGEFTSGLALTTVTFTSTTTWTAPPYVSNLVTMTGHGTNASSDDYSSDTYYTNLYTTYNTATTTTTSTPHDWSELYNNLQGWISYINTGSGRGSPIGRYFFVSYNIRSNNTYSQFQTPPTAGSDGFASEYFQYGTAADSSSFSVPSSGTITYANTTNGGEINISWKPVYLGGNGTAATGAGQTFPGGTYNFSTGIGGGYPTTNFSNITVTPNLSYSIVVPSGASISISFYAPA